MSERGDGLLFRGLKDDGLYTSSIKEHSLRKIELHNAYVSLFSRAMKNIWPQRAYVGLYSGPGRGRLAGTGEIVTTTPLAAVQVSDPFTKYIFVDNDPRCIEALEARIHALDRDYDMSCIEEDVSEAVPEIMKVMPSYSNDKGLLSFCFADPFSAKLDFEVFRTLGSKYKMDFLVLLMLGRDVRTNFRQYFQDENDDRIARLIDDENWRTEWTAGEYRPSNLIRFMLEKFNQAMTSIGYRRQRPDDAHPIRLLEKKNVLLYYLVLYSRNDLGRKFWNVARSGVDDQLRLL